MHGLKQTIVDVIDLLQDLHRAKFRLPYQATSYLGDHCNEAILLLKPFARCGLAGTLRAADTYMSHIVFLHCRNKVISISDDVALYLSGRYLQVLTLLIIDDMVYPEVICHVLHVSLTADDNIDILHRTMNFHQIICPLMR